MLDRLFLDYSEKKLRQLESRIAACLDKLTFEQVWQRGGDEQNAVGNLVLHLAGNVGQWLAIVTGSANARDRDAEFAARESQTPAELKSKLTETLSKVYGPLGSLSAERLQQRITVQGYDVSVLEAIYHVVEHFSMHTGQIVYITKLLRREDMGFYSHIARKTHDERTP